MRDISFVAKDGLPKLEVFKVRQKIIQEKLLPLGLIGDWSDLNQLMNFRMQEPVPRSDKKSFRRVYRFLDREFHALLDDALRRDRVVRVKDVARYFERGISPFEKAERWGKMISRAETLPASRETKQKAVEQAALTQHRHHHILLHHNLMELVAEAVVLNSVVPSLHTIQELIGWSKEQCANPIQHQ